MESHAVLCLLAGLWTIAGPLLFVKFCMSFREGTDAHPIYRGSEQERKAS